MNPERVNIPYYKYLPEAVTENDRYKIYWDREIVTDLYIPSNRPDIVFVDKESRQTFLIDIAVPHPTNLQQKRQEKINKYLPLANEIKEMWNQEKVAIVPIILGATGEIPKLTLESLDLLDIRRNRFSELQKIVLIETAGMVRKVLNAW